MNELGRMILSLSLSGTFTTVLFFLLKHFYKHCLSKTWQYYVLLIVIISFLVPVGFENGFTGKVMEQVGTYIETEQVDISEQTMDLPIEPVIDEPANKNIAAYFIRQWLGMIWFIPAAFLLVRKVVQYIWFVKKLKNSGKQICAQHIIAIYDEICGELSIRRPPSLLQVRQSAVPMLLGMIKPVLILPDTEIAVEELRYILMHELIHYRRRDILYKWLVQISVYVHWFNPAAYWISREISRSCELACDEAVISRLDSRGRHSYGDLLLATIRYDQWKYPVNVSLSEDAKHIKERLDAIMKYKKKSKRSVLLSLLLTAIMICGAVLCGSFYLGKSSTIQAKNKVSNGPIIQSQSATAEGQNFVYEKVEMREYEGEGAHPYIHEISINNTEKSIADCQYGMLAYDQEGNPLEIDWWSLDTEYDPSYSYLCTGERMELAPGEKWDVYGGFSLNFMGMDPNVEKIAYVLYSVKQLTFEDGTIWENPDYNDWLQTYRGKKTDVAILESYYPYTQSVY